MELDLHIHTNRYSGCSNIPPAEVIRQARKAGLDGIALTEHGIRWPDGEIRMLVESAGEAGLVVIAGEEVACFSNAGRFQGEFLVFGYPKSIGSSRPVEQVIDLVHGAAGVVIAAHPFKPHDTGQGYYGCGIAAWELDIDGLEIEHPDYNDEGRRLARRIMETRGLAGISCSDAHDLDGIGRYRTVFEGPVSDARSLCDAIRGRRIVRDAVRKI
jgi:predicted metal-dependent phosphoesterase TrpH